MPFEMDMSISVSLGAALVLDDSLHGQVIGLLVDVEGCVSAITPDGLRSYNIKTVHSATCPASTHILATRPAAARSSSFDLAGSRSCIKFKINGNLLAR
jgi:hypothetical protein